MSISNEWASIETSGEDLWDDTTILAMYNASINSHQTVPGKAKIRGESQSGGLSRKDKKKLLKQSLGRQDSCDKQDLECGSPRIESSSTGKFSESNASSQDASSHSFVQDFLAQTSTMPDVQGRSENGDGTESYTTTEVYDASKWVSLHGGPYHNCYITVQHHHHHYHGSTPSVGDPPATSSVPPTPEALQAWDALCAAKEQYDAALSRYEMFFSK
jgi:hypothetical protein